MNETRRPGYAFLLPWSYESDLGGVNNAVMGLADECLSEAVFRPVALESAWAFQRPEEDKWRGITRIRLRTRAPWSESRPFAAVVAYLLHLPADIYRLVRIIRSHDIRVINRQFPGLDSFTLIVMRRLRLFHGKVVFTFQGSDVRLILNTSGVSRRLLRWMLRRADLLVFVSEGLKEEFLPFDPQLSKHSVVIYNGVDINRFLKQADDPPPFFEAFQRSPVLVSVGRFEHRKGHDLLVRAFELVLKERSDARLAIIGRSGPEFDSTQQLIAERGLAAQTFLLTDIPHKHVPALIRRADVFVLCSRWEKGKFGEGFPLALAESGALTRPVVSTRSTGCDEIIRDYETGRLVELENPGALARAILDLLNNQQDAHRMAENLHKLVRERFTWQHAWRDYRRALGV